MSPTATATKNVLSELAQFEAAEREAKEHSSKLSHDLLNRNHRLLGHLDTPGATDELRRLQHREPEQFNGDGTPRKGTPAEKLAKEIGKLADDIQGLTPQVEQARRREAAAKLAREEFTPENIAAIIDAHRPEAEAIQAAIREKAAADHEFWANVTSFIQKLGALIGTVPTQRNVRVPGLDTAAEQMRTAERLDFPLPWTEARRV